MGAVALLAAFVVLKTYALGPAASDENIYFYMCRRIAEGAWPYGDFFFAHPPLHLLPGALLIGLAGFSLPLAKAIPAVFAGLAGLAIYRAARRAGPIQGLWALALFLFAYDLLRSSSHYTGVCESTALLAWALERALAGRAFVSGSLAAAAGLTAMYALPPAAAIGIFLAARRPGTVRRYALSFAALFGGVNLLCLALFGSGYLDPVYLYHLRKPQGGGTGFSGTLPLVIRENVWIMWSLPVLGMAWFVSRASRSAAPQPVRERSRDPARAAPIQGPGKYTRKPTPEVTDGRWEIALAGLVLGGLHLVFLAALGRVYTFYFIPSFVGLALAGGVGYPALLAAILGALKARRAPGRPRAAAALLAGVLTLAGAELARIAAERASGLGDDDEPALTYAWKDAPLPAALNGAIRRLFWRDERAPGGRYLSVTRYLWHESRHFQAPLRLAERVGALTPPGTTLFGDSLSAPLVALLAGRRLARDEADTNSMRFRSGITPPGELIDSLEREPPTGVIAAPRKGLFLLPEFQHWVTSSYELAESFDDPIYGRYLLYLRREPDPTAGDHP